MCDSFIPEFRFSFGLWKWFSPIIPAGDLRPRIFEKEEDFLGPTELEGFPGV
jgi:hypothetical protein